MEKILRLEKSLFNQEYMSNKEWLNEIIDDEYIEIGKSGKQINKIDVINELSNLKEDRRIIIYNFTCDKIDKNTYLVHYITRNKGDKIYRTSIWQEVQDEIKITFYQASLYNEEIELIEY